MANRKWWKPIFSGIIIIIMIWVWVVFAPIKAGGQATYIIINGNSMEPDFKTNDVVVILPEKFYQIGDAVAYRNPQLGIIFHRIVEQEKQFFILQGDNNDWLDSHSPKQEEIIGKLWMHIPSVGKYVEKIRSPGILALTIFGLMGFAFMNVNDPNNDNLSSQNRKKPKLGVTPSTQNQDSVFLLSALGFAALLLSVIAFNRPTKLAVQESIAILHKGSFEYQAAAVPTVYDQIDVFTGDPIFTNISDAVTVTVNYELNDKEISNFNGIYSFLAILKDDSGWEHTATLLPEIPFTEQILSINGTILFSDVRNWVNEFERITGVQRARYTLTFQPIIQISGEKRQIEFETTFSPEYSFSFEDKQVIPLAKDDENVLYPTSQHNEIFFSEIDNTLSIFNINVKVVTARIIAGAGFGLVLLLAGMNTIKGYLVAQDGEVAMIEYNYKEWLIDVEDAQTGKELVTLKNFNDLVKIAEKQVTLIQHAIRGDKHIYFITLPEATYIYQTKEE